jgi:hypothetical protein
VPAVHQPPGYVHPQDSHDAVVVDFWVEALRNSRSVSLNAWFASDEGHPAVRNLTGRTQGNDTFHLEVGQ